MQESLESRIAYLRGLADGFDVNAQSSEGKLISEMIEILDEMHAHIHELHARVEESEDYLEAIDEDLQDVEMLLFEDDDELYENIDDDDCLVRDQLYDEYADMDDDEDAILYETADNDHFDTTYEFACPNCQEVIFLHEGIDDDGFTHYVIEQQEDHAAGQEPINAT